MNEKQLSVVESIRMLGDLDYVDFCTLIAEISCDDNDLPLNLSEEHIFNEAFQIVRHLVSEGEFDLVRFDSASGTYLNMNDKLNSVCDEISNVVRRDGLKSDYCWLAVLSKREARGNV